MEFNSYKLLKRNTLIHPIEFGRQIRPSSPILGPHSKAFGVFTPAWTPLRGLRAIGCLARWNRVSLEFDFKS